MCWESSDRAAGRSEGSERLDVRVEVRMAYNNHLQPSQLFNLLDCVLVEIRNAIPQDVAVRCLD